MHAGLPVNAIARGVIHITRIEILAVSVERDTAGVAAIDFFREYIYTGLHH